MKQSIYSPIFYGDLVYKARIFLLVDLREKNSDLGLGDEKK